MSKLEYSKEDIIEMQDSITWWTNRFKAVERNNKELKELCDKYNKQHLKTIDLWKEDIERIDKAIEYIKHSQSYGTMAQVMPHLKPYVNGDDLLEILGGD